MSLGLYELKCVENKQMWRENICRMRAPVVCMELVYTNYSINNALKFYS